MALVLGSAASHADTLPQPLAAAVNRAKGAANKGGWGSSTIAAIQKENVAVAVYHRDETGETLIQVIGAKQKPVSFEYGQGEGPDGDTPFTATASGAPIWDLRGDGGKTLVFQSCFRGICESWRLAEIIGQSIVQPKQAPGRPTTLQDDDHDGIPEFSTALARVDVSTEGVPQWNTSIVVSGFESWDGKAYARDLLVLRPLYVKLLLGTRAVVASLPKPGSPACPVEALQAAAEIQLYAQLLGSAEPAARVEADAVMANRSTSSCRREPLPGEDAETPKSWGEIAAELAKVKLPKLDRNREVRRSRR
jgi:hypothetical protein